MKREQVTKWLDKQIELVELLKKHEVLNSDTELAGVRFKEIHVWVKNEMAFIKFMEALQPITVKYDPNRNKPYVNASFMYKGYNVFTLLNGGK